MEISLATVINTLEESLVNNLKKLEHFEYYKRKIELHLSETQFSINECKQEITSAKRLLNIFNQK
jgi:chromosome segregation ATPase